MTIVGHVHKTKLYSFDDGLFSFHTAFDGYNKETTVTVFRSKMDAWPSTTAMRKGIKYILLMGSTDIEVEEWLKDNPDKKVLQVTNT